MTELPRRFLLTGLGLAALAGCASPNPNYFTVAVVPGRAQPGGPRTVQIRRIGLAGYLDRNTIVRADTGYQLHIDDNQRWGEPPGDMIARVLAQDLTQRLPGSTIFTEAGAITADADTIVEIDVQRFDLDSSGLVVLAAQVAVERERNHNALAARALRFTDHPSSSATADLVAAMSVALGQLADAVADMLRGATPLSPAGRT
jgi:uncharacterized protein